MCVREGWVVPPVSPPTPDLPCPRAYGRFLAQRYLNPLAQGMQDLYRRPTADPG